MMFHLAFIVAVVLNMQGNAFTIPSRTLSVCQNAKTFKQISTPIQRTGEFDTIVRHMSDAIAEDSPEPAKKSAVEKVCDVQMFLSLLFWSFSSLDYHRISISLISNDIIFYLLV